MRKNYDKYVEVQKQASCVISLLQLVYYVINVTFMDFSTSEY